MSNYEELNGFLKQHEEFKGTKEEKYAQYLKKRKESKNPLWQSIETTFNVLSKSESARAHFQNGIESRRFLIAYANTGSNHGALTHQDRKDADQWGNWDEKTGHLVDGLIVISNEYKDNWLMSACVLAHEYRHILDIEETKLGRLNIGIQWNDPDSLNEAEPQRRANINAGIVAVGLKYNGERPFVEGWTAQQKEVKNADWGPNWCASPDACAQVLAQFEMYKDFLKQTPTLTKQKCGRRCKDFKHHGYCDHEVYFPPCWQH